LYFLGLSLRNISNILEHKAQKEVMLLYGIGYKDLVLLKSMTNVKEFLLL
jgi:hypothetical protein